MTAEREWHPIIAATRESALRSNVLADGRLQPIYEPGVVEVRVSRPQLNRAMGFLQDLIDLALGYGLRVGPVARAKGQRCGAGIGREPYLVPIQLVETRVLVPFEDLDLDEWRRATPVWSIRECELRDRGWVPRPSGQLSLRLPLRRDRAPNGEPGWQARFSDQNGRPLERQLDDAVRGLVARADRDTPTVATNGGSAGA